MTLTDAISHFHDQTISQYTKEYYKNRALSVLSDEHRLVLMLHDVEGYKLKEIQIFTEEPMGTLKSRLHRARARLREIVADDATFS